MQKTTPDDDGRAGKAATTEQGRALRRGAVQAVSVGCSFSELPLA
ncbi:hypothetical protein SAMN05428945_1905 [Streptomyces sp. 2224.1]|nr:hypothetical protein BX261_3420 [Streptomyces sp. 2321.6]SDR42028.1 hypothetical protein SAMN05216511_3781 [Streptomyces sp. KS_16]SEC05709.1 hypothetical protein SAMN05428945_1905 [Streptomyces sp. 2224.1]SEC97802.1 hypothetical protein SAMN05428940_3421 [Streptomyces sp. 2133.1]SEE77333.1 hypothetical protein SAMN05428954_3831 [Streptomyces sp. 2112.3]SNC69550.1 hypothetical protein SAMN06272741_3413 [Streptomyces sp. 2114.4]